MDHDRTDDIIEPLPEPTGTTSEHEGPLLMASAVQTQAPPAPEWDPRTGRWVDPGEPAPVFRAPPARPRRARSPVLLAGVAGGLVGALVATAVLFGAGLVNGGAAPIVERRLTPGLAGSGQGASIVGIAERARPWVVNINVQGRQAGVFGSQLVQGTGSGLVLRSDGHVLTNAHVIDGADEIEVTLASGERLSATLVGIDRDTDIAVVKTDRDDLPPAVIGSAKDLRVGELAVAIGSPLGLEQTVTSGIISALGRRVSREDSPPLVDMIQTDAPITQGNSGGALINGEGAVIGINTAIAASPQVGAEGIAFAIPIDIALSVAEELIETGRATHPWIGISGGNITAETARRFGITAGALVIDVVPGGPAEAAGIRPQDIIVNFDGEPIESMDELIVVIRERKVGQEVDVEVVRDGQQTTLEVTLGNKPGNI